MTADGHWVFLGMMECSGIRHDWLHSSVNVLNALRYSPPPFFFLFRAALATYGGSQARGPIGVVAAGLRHSHSNVGTEPHL